MPNEFAHRAGPPFLDNHFRGYHVIISHLSLCYYITGSDYNFAGTRPGEFSSNLRFYRIRNTPSILFMVPILDDDIPEPVEVIHVQVVCENNENCYSPRSFYTITIIDDQGNLL